MEKITNITPTAHYRVRHEVPMASALPPLTGAQKTGSPLRGAPRLGSTGEGVLTPAARRAPRARPRSRRLRSPRRRRRASPRRAPGRGRMQWTWLPPFRRRHRPTRYGTNSHTGGDRTCNRPCTDRAWCADTRSSSSARARRATWSRSWERLLKIGLEGMEGHHRATRRVAAEHVERRGGWAVGWLAAQSADRAPRVAWWIGEGHHPGPDAGTSNQPA